MPTHNRADVIGFAIESVLAQDVADFELLIVGDGCTDNTAEIVRSFNDDRILWFDMPKGPGFGYANRNIALRQARGKYIGFMAHDDLVFHDHYKLCIGALEKNEQLELAYSRPLWIAREGEIIPVEFNLDIPATLEPFLECRRNMMPATCVVHRRECFNKYGYWDDSLPAGADMEMWARIIKGGNRKNFIFLPVPTCLHFIAIWKKNHETGLIVAEQWLDFYNSSPDIPEVLKTEMTGIDTEQSIIWKKMSANPVKWVAVIRRAVVQVFDLKIASYHEEMNNRYKVQDDLENKIIDLEKKIIDLENDLKLITDHGSIYQRQNEELVKRISALEFQLITIKRSYSWKIGRSFTWLPGFLIDKWKK
jgi:glycosyltransferase involved in cell wall biosynthesis